VIRNFGSVGIAFVPNASTPCQIFVSNTLISGNGAIGIEINVLASAAVNGILDNIKSENNTADGLFLQAGPGTINLTISDSVIANNGNDGINSLAGTGSQNFLMLRNSTVANNVNDGLQATGTDAIFRVTRSTITGNVNAGWDTGGSGTVSSYDDNNIDGNGSNNSTPPSPLVYH
jgi:hypothetical protein